jgi:hypothetical protein
VDFTLLSRPLGEVLATMLPPNSRRESRRTVILRSDSVQVVDDISLKVIDELRRQGQIDGQGPDPELAGQNIDRVLARLERRARFASRSGWRSSEAERKILLRRLGGDSPLHRPDSI